MKKILKRGRIEHEPVWTTKEAIEALRGSGVGSTIIIYMTEYHQEEEIKKQMKTAGINVEVESWPTLREKPGTREYQVKVVE